MSPTRILERSELDLLHGVFENAGQRIEGADLFLVMRQNGQEELIALTEHGVVGSSDGITDALNLLSQFAVLQAGQGVFSKPVEGEISDMVDGIPVNSSLKDLFKGLDHRSMNALQRAGVTTWGDLQEYLQSEKMPAENKFLAIRNIGAVTAERIMQAADQARSKTK